MPSMPSSNQPQPAALSPVAEALLREMAANPQLIRYHTNVLGGSFRDEDVVLLDQAYEELLKLGLIESANAIISFFGAPKRLYRINDAGKNAIAGFAA